MRRSLWSYAWLIIFFVLLGCTPAEYKSLPTATAENSKYLEQINKAEELWGAQNITSYRVTLSFHENFGGIHNTERTVEVSDGKIVASSCPSDNCPIFVLKNIQTVDDLFGMAKGGTIPDKNAKLDECIKNLAFDATYGLPTSVSIDCPYHSDEEHSVQVISFEVLK